MYLYARVLYPGVVTVVCNSQKELEQLPEVLEAYGYKEFEFRKYGELPDGALYEVHITKLKGRDTEAAIAIAFHFLANDWEPFEGRIGFGSPDISFRKLVE